MDVVKGDVEMVGVKKKKKKVCSSVGGKETKQMLWVDQQFACIYTQ